MALKGFTVSEAAEVIGVSRQAVHYLCKRGRLVWWLEGARIRISRRSAYSYRDLRDKLREVSERQKAIGLGKHEELGRRRAKLAEEGRRYRK